MQFQQASTVPIIPMPAVGRCTMRGSGLPILTSRATRWARPEPDLIGIIGVALKRSRQRCVTRYQMLQIVTVETLPGQRNQFVQRLAQIHLQHKLIRNRGFDFVHLQAVAIRVHNLPPFVERQLRSHIVPQLPDRPVECLLHCGDDEFG